MLRISLTVQSTAGRRRLEGVVEALSDLTPILRHFGAYLRAKAKARFEAEGPGWAPLAGSTAHRLIHTFTGKLTHAGAVRQTHHVQRLRQQLRRDVKADRVDLRLLTAFERASRSTGGGALGEALRVHLRGQKYGKKLVALAKALDRAKAAKRRPKQRRAITRHHHLLGKLASSIRAQVKKSELVVGSIVEWAGVHNVGGPAGHGATMPARTFIELDDEDFDELQDLIVGAAGLD